MFSETTAKTGTPAPKKVLIDIGKIEVDFIIQQVLDKQEAKYKKLESEYKRLLEKFTRLNHQMDISKDTRKKVIKLCDALIDVLDDANWTTIDIGCLDLIEERD